VREEQQEIDLLIVSSYSSFFLVCQWRSNQRSRISVFEEGSVMAVCVMIFQFTSTVESNIWTR